MSLNRTEQQLFEYIRENPEERQYWEYKVRRKISDIPDRSEVARQLDSELWQYYLERAGVVPRFKDAVRREGTKRVSIRNLAEYLIRLWAPPPPKKPAGS